VIGMFHHLLIPLDGSGLAETTLPYVRTLAHGSGDRAHVTLLHLIERAAPSSVHGARHLTTVPDAETYLTEIAARFRAAGITVATHVDTNEGNDTAGRIVDHAAEMQADLIVLCAHGRSGLGRWLFGSIAQKVLAVGVAPVLMVIPTKHGAPPHFGRILVPLDGSTEAEIALLYAREIVGALGGTLDLVYAVPKVESLTGGRAAVARYSPTASAALLDEAEEGATTYMGAIADRLRADHIAVEATIVRDDPATAIVKAAGRSHADLIVMASHGRAGMAGAWAGSVSSKVLARAPGPFLLVRAPGTPQHPA